MSPWWRHQMETFSALLALCVGNSPVTGEIPSQRPVARSFDVFFDLRLNKWLNKQSRGWWFETHRAQYIVTVIHYDYPDGNDSILMKIYPIVYDTDYPQSIMPLTSSITTTRQTQ